MPKLRTLKDFGWWTAPNTSRCLSIEVFHLKNEAIKWVKEKTIELEKTNTNTPQFDGAWVAGQIYWIKHFFNLTDEDLK